MISPLLGTDRGTNWLLVVAPSCWAHWVLHNCCCVGSGLLGTILLLNGVILNAGLHIIVNESRGNFYQTPDLFLQCYLMAVTTISYQFEEGTKIKKGHLFCC